MGKNKKRASKTRHCLAAVGLVVLRRQAARAVLRHVGERGAGGVPRQRHAVLAEDLANGEGQLSATHEDTAEELCFTARRTGLTWQYGRSGSATWHAVGRVRVLLKMLSE